MRNKYKDQKSIEQQFAEAKLVAEKDKEHFDPILTPSLIVGGTALIYRYGPEISEAAMKYGPILLSIMMDPPKINKKDEIDNLDDIKNYKPIIISGKKNIEEEKEGKEEITNVESTSASSPSPLPDPNKDDKDKKENKVNSLERKGSATKEDPYHAFNDIIDNYADEAHKFEINNGELYQVEGSLNGVDGRFEWIIEDGRVTHRMFIRGGVINGTPISPYPSLSTDFLLRLMP